MRVQYDPAKAAANLRAHGVSFAGAEGVLIWARRATRKERKTYEG